jgi:hypothetical protein
VHIDELVTHLDAVRPTGKSRYMARCPAHADKSPSLAISEGDDGRILIHCFAGCNAPDVLAAMGLTINDLFAEPLGHHFKPTRNQISRREAWLICKREFYLLGIALSDYRKGKTPSSDDEVRIDAAITHIARAVERTDA